MVPTGLQLIARWGKLFGPSRGALISSAFRMAPQELGGGAAMTGRLGPERLGRLPALPCLEEARPTRCEGICRRFSSPGGTSGAYSVLGRQREGIVMSTSPGFVLMSLLLVGMQYVLFLCQCMGKTCFPRVSHVGHDKMDDTREGRIWLVLVTCPSRPSRLPGSHRFG